MRPPQESVMTANEPGELASPACLAHEMDDAYMGRSPTGTAPSTQEAMLMPLVRIDLARGKTEHYRRTVGDVVYDAMIATLNVPANDRFQIIAEHSDSDFIIDKTYLGVERSDDVIVIQVTLNAGRSVELKRAFYKAVADGLHQSLGLRREDVFIGLIETAKENWSFGNGEAQYA
jgi:phenylpyruvate tautomerase PptA (4-oxalocrotonate tautomerase family)